LRLAQLSTSCVGIEPSKSTYRFDAFGVAKNALRGALKVTGGGNVLGGSTVGNTGARLGAVWIFAPSGSKL